MHLLAGLFPFVSIDGIDFDPFIRGWLVVVVGSVVLYGSVYLINATNTGARTGFVLSLTAFFGWIMIMGVIWTIYGIGLKGPGAQWEPSEINRGDLAVAQFEKARPLGTALDALAVAEGKPISELLAEAETAGVPLNLAGWNGMLLSNAARGEAQATVDAFLIGRKEFESNSRYVPIGAFQRGGKAARGANAAGCNTQNIVKVIYRVFMDGKPCFHRAAAKLHMMFAEPFHPEKNAVVLIQPITERSQITRPGQAPPKKEVDQDQPILAVVMTRDLGSVRLPPAMITLMATGLFCVFAWILHDRDKREAANRSRALVPAGAR